MFGPEVALIIWLCIGPFIAAHGRGCSRDSSCGCNVGDTTRSIQSEASWLDIVVPVPHWREIANCCCINILTT